MSPKIVTFLFWHTHITCFGIMWAVSSHGAAKGGFMITWAATSLLRGKHMSFREPLFSYKRRPLLHMKWEVWELIECKIGWSIEDASRLIVTIPTRRKTPLSGSFPVDVANIGEPRISWVKFSTLSLSLFLMHDTSSCCMHHYCYLIIPLIFLTIGIRAEYY